MPNKKGSKAMDMSFHDWRKVVKGACIAVSGAAIVYLNENIGSIDFGTMTPFVTAFWAIVINTLHRYFTDTRST